MSVAIGIVIGVVLTLAAVIAAGADVWVGRDLAPRPPAGPPATRREIRRDRRDRIADISRARSRSWLATGTPPPSSRFVDFFGEERDDG